MRILLLDDHPLLRKGIAQTLLERSLATQVLETALASEAMQILEDDLAIDCLFLDLQLPDRHGLDVLSDLKKRGLEVSVMVLTATREPEMIYAAMQTGANAYLGKASMLDELTEALDVVKQGGQYISRDLRAGFERYCNILNQPSISRISKRQRQVLHHLSLGQSNRQIAESLMVSESTIKGHVSTLFDILDVDNRTHCVQEAQKRGLLTVSS